MMVTDYSILANVGMYSCLAAFLDEGDEVIVPAPHLYVFHLISFLPLH